MNKAKNKKNRIFGFLTLALALLTMLPATSYAEDAFGENEPDRYVEVKLIPEKTHVSGGEEIWIGIDHEIYPHWHLYWANPGDSGIPIATEWTLPDGAEIEEIQWPLPEKIDYDPLANYGYSKQVTLLQKLKLPENLPPGKINLSAEVKMLVCNEVCIPETAEVTLTLNDENKDVIDNNDYIETATAKIPADLAGDFTYTKQDHNVIVTITPEDKNFLNNVALETAEFFPLEWGVINHFPTPDRTKTGNTITISHPYGTTELEELKTLEGLLTFKDTDGTPQGVRIVTKQSGDFNKKASATPSTEQNTSNPAPENDREPVIKAEITTLGGALLFAFLGGLILNLMPCVFPVISMKALSLVKLSGKEKKEARLHGIAYTFGVILSFLLIGAILVGLKETGSAIGWGFQLQNPIVIGALAYLLFVIGLNLMGFFEIGNKFGNVGNKLTGGHSLASSFFTGTLATIVATPCMAPFMAAALGYALVQPAAVSMSVFLALALGLAFPYLLLCFVPAAQKILPRPGAWMDTFKQFLAFPMFGFAIWLVSILSYQTGAIGVLYVLIGMLMISMAIWVMRVMDCKKCTSRTILVLALLALPVLGLFEMGKMATPANSTNEQTKYSFGENFSNEKLATYLEGTDPVFVEMTAAWCITCKVNHATSINIDSTKELFQDENIKYLIGDWTNYDETITAYLGKYGRNGVPIYVFYGARDEETGKRPAPVLLPQVLTPGTIKKYVMEK